MHSIMLVIFMFFYQVMHPGFQLVTPIEMFVCMIMYFTIENPDLKLINELELAKSNAEKADLALEKLSNKNKQFGKSPLNTNSIENNFKEITYEGVIANALTMGRLENYCLICNGNDFETYLQTN